MGIEGWEDKSEVSKEKPIDLELYGQLDQQLIEAMLIGYLISDPDLPSALNDIRDAEMIVDSGIKGFWFENTAFGAIFDDLVGHLSVSKKLLTSEEASHMKKFAGMTATEAEVYDDTLTSCKAAMSIRRIDAKILIRLTKNKHRCKHAAKLYSDFVKRCSDEAFGPEKALDLFRESCTTDLADPGAGAIKEYDISDNFDDTVVWLKDMKENPDKYRGFECGIKAIDGKTNGGFRPGHLTVLVGKPGGYKSRLLVNLAYGLWNRGYDVLYVSLEMEAKLIATIISAIGCRYADYSRLFRGQITEASDWDTLNKAKVELVNPSTSEERKRFLEQKIFKLTEALSGVEPGKEDLVLLEKFKEKVKSKKNKIKVINCGQSEKIKMSQIERYLRDKESTFRPQVIIVDYLALVASEKPYPDRRDLEVGDVCNYMRNMGEQMGFSVITAAQLKRAALERIRKAGGEKTPEKAGFGTDDIAESHQIAMAADTIFVLWPMGLQLKVLCPKARHGVVDSENGAVLHINHSNCIISDTEVEDTMTKGDTMSPEDIFGAASKMVGKGPSVQDELDPLEIVFDENKDAPDLGETPTTEESPF